MEQSDSTVTAAGTKESESAVKELEIINEDSNLGSEIGESQAPSVSASEKVNEETSKNSSECSTPARKFSITRMRGARAFACSQSDMYGEILPENVREYEWPPKSGHRFFLQEQVMEYLGVKSFKRKYPNLSRRPVETEEREYIKDLGVVGETQADLGLTALITTEVMEIMAKEYPELYEAYQKAVAERTKELLAAKQREMDSLKSDSKKLNELRKRAMQAAADWNADFNRDKKRERRDGFWDLQTMIIQVPQSSCVKLSAEETDPGAYPVAVMTGQFQNHYKRYTSDELKKMPVNTVMNCEDFLPIKRPHSPPSITVELSELKPETPEPEETPVDEDTEKPPPKQCHPADKGPESDRGEETGDRCAVCRDELFTNDRYVACSQCGSMGHPRCLDMTEEMFETAQAYDWMCMECKPCSVCKHLDGEDKMMFCDKCDRGYHTYCVGLNALPTGRWVCAKFCAGPTLSAAGSVASGSGRSTPATPGGPKRCNDCDVVLTKTNKLHHRNKLSKEGICIDCAASR